MTTIRQGADDDEKDFKGIPKLNDNNYIKWSVRIRSHLKARWMWNVCTSESNISAEATDAAQSKELKLKTEVADVILKSISERALDLVVPPNNSEDPYCLWSTITKRFTSMSINNKGRICLQFMRLKVDGYLNK